MAPQQLSKVSHNTTTPTTTYKSIERELRSKLPDFHTGRWMPCEDKFLIV
jgi:hypothetical protein